MSPHGMHFRLALLLACWLVCLPLSHAVTLTPEDIERIHQQLAVPELPASALRSLLAELQHATLIRCEREHCDLAAHQHGRQVSDQLLLALGQHMRRQPELAMEISRVIRSWRYVRADHPVAHESPVEAVAAGSEEPALAQSSHQPQHEEVAHENSGSTVERQQKQRISSKQTAQKIEAIKPDAVNKPNFASSREISPDMHRVGVNRRMEQSMLLQQAIDLRLATSETEASKVLEQLKHANITVFGVPCEDLYCQSHQPAVYAATMDTLLAELASAVHRWPSLAHRIGQTVLSWQYCDIRYRNRNRDLFVRGGQHFRRMAGTPSPAHQQGWQQWGFLEQQDEGRLIPEPLRHHGLTGRAKAAFLYRYVHQRCFPDPETGRTPYDITEPMYAGPQHDFPDKPGRDYPYQQQWLNALHQQLMAVPDVPELPENAPEPMPVLPPQAEGEQRLSTSRGNAGQQKAKHSPVSDHEHIHQARASLVAREARPSSVSQPPVVLPSRKPEDTEVLNSSQVSPDPSDPQSVPPTRATLKPRRPTQVSIFNKWKMGDNQQELGLNAFWSPFDYFYVRGSVSTRLPARGKNPGYTWGIGYNDWHPGGLIVEFNQWTPQQFGRNTNIREAEFNLGWRIPFPESWAPYIDGTLNARMVGKTPNIGGLWNLRYKDYFVRFGVSKDLRGPNGWQWVYGFGRWHWQAGSINIEYDNWGGNSAFTPNFRRNGEVLLEYRFDL